MIEEQLTPEMEALWVRCPRCKGPLLAQTRSKRTTFTKPFPSWGYSRVYYLCLPCHVWIYDGKGGHRLVIDVGGKVAKGTAKRTHIRMVMHTLWSDPFCRMTVSGLAATLLVCGALVASIFI